MNDKVSQYFSNLTSWQAELFLLRKFVLHSQLTETFKWKQPCYTFNNNNILLIFKFKDYCGISFFKGALLSDNEGVLFKPGANSQAVKQLRFTSLQEIQNNEKDIAKFIEAAIEIEKSERKIKFDDKHNLELVGELKAAFINDPQFMSAFEALTLGRQRGYNLFFAGAKQSGTRKARIEKYKSRILSGKGIHDCICGLSQRMPRCDGSHKTLNKTN